LWALCSSSFSLKNQVTAENYSLLFYITIDRDGHSLGVARDFSAGGGGTAAPAGGYYVTGGLLPRGAGTTAVALPLPARGTQCVFFFCLPYMVKHVIFLWFVCISCGWVTRFFCSYVLAVKERACLLTMLLLVFGTDAELGGNTFIRRASLRASFLWACDTGGSLFRKGMAGSLSTAFAYLHLAGFALWCITVWDAFTVR
jgi:hypothetical protein